MRATMQAAELFLLLYMALGNMKASMGWFRYRTYNKLYRHDLGLLKTFSNARDYFLNTPAVF